MAELTPDEIASKSFPTAFRGFNVDEVRSFLLRLAEQVDELAAERMRLAARVTELGDKDLQQEFETIGREVSSVLEAARLAAEGIRERAAADAATWRSQALAEAEAERRQARADAEQLRGDAWTTGEELLNQAQREASRLVDEAEKDALRRVGEAEREAHRLLVAARREAEDLVRNARMESERLAIEARSRHDDILETAQRQAESAQERTRALEQRRDELKRELDSVREALSAMEGELDERRERLGLAGHHPEDVERPPGEEHPGWTPGETVRVVRAQSPAPSGRAEDVQFETQQLRADELNPEIKVISADEVARRRGEAPSEEPAPAEQPPAEEPPVEKPRSRAGQPQPARREQVAAAPPEEPEPRPEPQPEPVPEPEWEPQPQPQLQPEPRPQPQPPPEPAPRVVTPSPPPVQPEPEGGRFDELAGLFDRLRTPDSDDEPEDREPREAPAEPAPAPPPSTAGDAPAREEASPRPRPVATLPSGIDPFELRERLLLPITNRALRNLKRQLTEEQNVTLEELRVHETAWEPDPAQVREHLQPDLVVLVAESFAAGHAAAEEVVGERLPRPPAPQTELAEAVAPALSREIAHVLEEARAEGHGSRQLAASVSRVFRGWRTDEAERRVRDLSNEAYHRGLAQTLALAQWEDLRWVVSGRGCASCRAAGEEEVSAFPPAHPGCGCTLVPA